MDVPRYKLNNRTARFNWEGDIMDEKLKSGGRYWSTKYSALERHANLKRARVRVLAPGKAGLDLVDEDDDFIPLSTLDSSVVEESWDDQVLHKTREFNKLTREHPHDENVWLDFANFQDTAAGKERKKGVRRQIFEKKISILEKAVELNPDNEQLLLSLMKAYQSTDSIDILIGRWERMLVQHPGNYKLWRQFLRVVQGDFSRFKVSNMRKMYAHAIQALSVASCKQFRQVLKLIC